MCQNRAVVQCQSRAVDQCQNRVVDRCRNRAVSQCQDSSAETCHGNSAGLCQSSPARMSARTSSGAKCATTDKISKDQEQAILRPRTRTAILRNLPSQSQICGQQENNSF